MPFFKLKYWILAGMLLPLVLIVLALVRPAGPDYRVLERADGFELREYAPLRVAETEVTGDFADADDAAYPRLLDYVRGHNSSGRKVPMMAPATQQRAGDDTWLMQFALAREYPLGMLPGAADPAVTVREIPARLVAARRSGGGWSEARWQEEAERLRDAVAAAGLTPIGATIFARYNAVFVPGFLRRNEVLLPVRR
ncbi:heme-binding protein [uncultured Thiohalocapsa sp.]|uniref:SOUL family heme-binding protein n=1 Tax=uncultured Thiohalocapsa sp. TaxID=768990 RepID=UPI0026002D45|nr:heme-binding protein [uncultured Thiohalocapsa sp.]